MKKTSHSRVFSIEHRQFWVKLGLLVVFSLAFMPLAALKESAPYNIYLILLAGIHVYFLAVLFLGISWKNLVKSKPELLVRLLLITLLALLLIGLGRSPLKADIVTFLTLSFVLHVGLISVLHVRVSRRNNIAAKASSSQKVN